MELGFKPLYEIVETFVNSLFKIVSAFLALLGFGPKETPKEDASDVVTE